MSNTPTLATLTLPVDFVAEDLLGFRDQLNARVAALVPPEGASANGDVVLPAGLQPLAALPPHIDRPWRRFDAATNELQKLRQERAGAQADAAVAAGNETEKDASNADADDRWRAVEAWNKGAAALAEDGATPSPAEARWLYAQLFPASDGGLRFITRRPRAQWTAMVQRMGVLEGERAQAVIAGFSGARHYTQLLTSHARFGKAYGFTTAVIEAVGGPTDGRPQWVNAREAMRTLVQKIESFADPEIEVSEALAAFLLAPYVEMVTDLEKSRRARPKKPEAAPPAPAPAKPTP